MKQHRYTGAEVAARAKAIYEEHLRAKLEPEHIGKFLVIDIETGEYEIDQDDIAAMKRAAARQRPDALYGMRIGYRTMGRIGARQFGGQT